MHNPLFSVLIANYNNGRFLGEALDSIYRQSYDNWEIIIVDDHSKDCSHEMYKEISNNPKIKIYYNDSNQGAGYTKRRCAELANGEISAFLDPDDALSNNALEKMVEAHINMPDASLIYSTSYRCDEDLKVMSINDAPKEIEQNNPLYLNMESSISHFASFKNSYYSKTSGIDSYLQRAVDQDLYLKLYEVGKTYFLNEILYYYRIHKSGISTNNNINKAYFWHWVVIINTGKRRGINFEDLFCESFVQKAEYDRLENKYLRLKKYEKLNNLLANLKKKL